jgi:hypothetical protein
MPRTGPSRASSSFNDEVFDIRLLHDRDGQYHQVRRADRIGRCPLAVHMHTAQDQRCALPFRFRHHQKAPVRRGNRDCDDRVVRVTVDDVENDICGEPTRHYGVPLAQWLQA